jgi:DNA-binding GntR family transcriptional regulator
LVDQLVILVYSGIIVIVTLVHTLGDGTATARPKFLQVAEVIAQEIEQGRLTGRLPTERELCEHFSVSRVTLRRALSTLADNQQVRASWGRGWYVVREPLSEPPNALISFSELAEGRGLTPSTKLLGLSTRPSTLDEADMLRVAPGSRLLVLERLRFLDSVPVVLQRSHLALARLEGLAEMLGSLDLTRISLYRLLEDRWGLAAARADYVVEARPATGAEAELLDIAPGSPLLQATQLTFDVDGNPFEQHWSSYPGDRYRFEARLLRPVRPRPPGWSGPGVPFAAAPAGAAPQDGNTM